MSHMAMLQLNQLRAEKVLYSSSFKHNTQQILLHKSFVAGDAKNGCHGSMLIEAYAARHAFKVPYKSSGKGGFKAVKFKFKAIAHKTRISFFSSYYHSKLNYFGILC